MGNPITQNERSLQKMILRSSQMFSLMWYILKEIEKRWNQCYGVS